MQQSQGQEGGHLWPARLQATWKLRTLLSGIGGTEWLVSQS